MPGLRIATILVASAAGAWLLAAHCVRASDSEQQTQFSGIFTLTTDYRFRGISNSDRQISPQLELDWNGPNGWTVGTFISAVDFEDHENTSVEIDLFATKHFDLRDAAIDISAYYYAYPDHDRRPGSPTYSTLEGIGSFSREIGSLSVNATAAWSPNYAGETGLAWDLEGGASYAVLDWLNASGHFGEQWVHEWDGTQGAGYPYRYWDLGLTASHGPFSFDLRFVGTNLSNAQCALTRGGGSWCGRAIVASVAYAWNWEWPFRPAGRSRL